MPEMANMSELDKGTLFWESELLASSTGALLSLRDSRGYGMCENEIKPRKQLSLDVYKHCNVPSDS